MQIKKNISLKNKNWFKTGGHSKFYCEPKNMIDFQEAIKFAKVNKLEIFALGHGANVLINDDGFDGLTIKPQLKNITIKYISKNAHFLPILVTAHTSVKIQDLIDFCLKNNLIGLEEFSAIPGTVGGSTYINIHYFNSSLSDFIHSATIINKDSGKIFNVDKNWFNFGYDKSKLQKKENFLISTTFKLKKVNDFQTYYAKGRRYEIIRHRQHRYPNSNTCGSFFKNFLPQEIDFEINNKKITSIAYYLDKLGIKGKLKIGNAIISPKHANMIETLPGATTTDIIKLAKQMQKLVKKEFGIIPKPECQVIGFKKNPFL
ncbi:UDP-N-acetylmuramate dehydrogenase [Candidatus Dependentiae bacterium]|nr:UDP-N-acetylmuramate dehydrogenase [Candidatus Dependentiae bacterium]